MNDLEKLCAVQIVISDLEKQIDGSQAQGHLYTTISTLRNYAESLKQSVNEKLERVENELRV
jgi:hypothetical protein